MMLVMISAANIIQDAQSIGALPGQAILALGLIVLGAVVIHLHRNSERKVSSLHQENKMALDHLNQENRDTVERFLKKMDEKDAQMNAERISRINMLMDMVRENTATNTNLINAVKNNTDAINELKGLIRDQQELIQRLSKHVNTTP